MFPIPIPSPTSLSTRSLWVFPVHIFILTFNHRIREGDLNRMHCQQKHWVSGKKDRQRLRKDKTL